VDYEKNAATSQRVGKITVSGGGITRDVTVTQKGAEAYLTVEPANRDVTCAAGQTTFAVHSNITWTVSESVAWLSVDPMNGNGNCTLKVDYEKNATTSQRVGKITVSGGGITREVTVTQIGAEAYLTVEPAKQDVEYSAGQATFELKSNTAWTATEDEDWLKITPAAGNGDATLTVDYDENSDTNCRTALIVVSGAGIEVKITLKQEAAPMLTITPPSCSLGFEACDTALVIISNTEWTIEVSENWIIVTPTSGSGDDTVQVHFEENIDLNPRTAILTISGGGLSVEVEFTQDGVTDIAGNMNEPPTEYMLQQNYPNPFNPTTTISFSLPEATNVILEIYNSSGQKIETLMNTKLHAGNHSVKWNAGRISSGIYFCRLKTNTFQDIKKMILAK
jgi:hypothetical protein